MHGKRHILIFKKYVLIVYIKEGRISLVRTSGTAASSAVHNLGSDGAARNFYGFTRPTALGHTIKYCIHGLLRLTFGEAVFLHEHLGQPAFAPRRAPVHKMVNAS